MTYKQIETSREIRLWITGIVGPVLLGAATIIASDKELLDQTKNFMQRKKNEITTKLKKGKEA